MAVFRKDQTPAQAVAYSAPRALTAAASQLKIKDKAEAEQFKARRSSSVSQWQAEAWEYYDAIGEIKYAFGLVGAIASRVRLYAAVVDDPAESPVNVHSSEKVDPQLADAAQRALARLDSAYGGQAGLLRDASLNLLVAGECFLVQMPARPGTGLAESWDVRSVDELKIDGRNQYVLQARRDISSTTPTVIPPEAFVGRIWRSHPRFTDEPDSSMKGILDLCAELLLLNRTFRATARSRLNAGAMYLPDGLSVAAQPESGAQFEDEIDITAPTEQEEEDYFETQLVDAMTTPISDEASASAVVPLIIRGPAELGDKIKLFKFERSFDPALSERSDRVLERILQGLDVPKDTVTGLANVKYSNAVQIDESLYKAHIEPMLLLLSDALTVVYLRPYLRSVGYTEAEVQRIVVWYDPSAVSTRADRAADADSGFEKGALSFDTWRRTHGFSDADAPSPTETAIRMVLDRGSITPELTEAVLGAFAPEAMDAAKAQAQASSVAPVPTEVQQMLNGAPAAPAPGAAAPEEAPAAPIDPGNVPEGDGPPVPLAEPV
ncbi:MAG: hypothetical protein ACRC5T_03775 [Cetobacterium sp.]